MLIVNQNKEEIIVFEQVISIYIEDSIIKARIPENDLIYLGVYQTDERAKEVLYEIIEKYRAICEDTYFIVYEMPEE